MNTGIRTKLIEHLRTWMPIYEAVGHLCVVLAVIVSVLGIVYSRSAVRESAKAVSIANDALSLSRNAFDLQKTEFRLRNRPFLIFTNPRFGGPTKDRTGNVYPRSVLVDMGNVSDIPATQIRTTIECYLDGNKIIQTKITYTSSTRTPGLSLPLPLKEEWFTAANSAEHEFYVTYSSTYAGMLGESNETYRTSLQNIYDPHSGAFRYHELKLE